MTLLLASAQWMLAVAIGVIVLRKTREIKQLPATHVQAEEDLLQLRRSLSRGLYALRILPSVAMSLAMLIGMLDLSHALAINATKTPVGAFASQKDALEHAVMAISVGAFTAACGYGAWAWLRRKIAGAFSKIQHRFHLLQSAGKQERTKGF